MSMESSSTPARPEGQYPDVAAAGSPHPADAAGIRRQASAIIEAVLKDSTPDHARVRDLLRKHLAAHPGRPERALVEHLISLKALTGFPAGSPDTPSLVDGPDTPTPAETRAGEGPGSGRSRIEAVLKGRMLLTAFQPILELSTSGIVGAEAFTRFVTDGGDTAYWFAEAADARLGSDLEFAALESALAAAQHLPDHLYVALKLSPATCLDPLLPDLLLQSPLSPCRVVLELTEAPTVEQPEAIVRALAPLRHQGVRMAIDHAGSYAGSVRHISQLRPDFIKLDRNLIAGIDTDALRNALGEAMTGLAEQIGAAVIAEGIETASELATVTALGMTAAQGYFLGRPTTRPEDWAGWIPRAEKSPSRMNPDGAVRS
ncbi:EAL domain-containing protein [Pseudarthrobacter sp. S9]|uniref:EAL domain-containing protein n=1 Tax=Pseudarthrobacter sp. S9 TaxID=3418421 RepID=UPI003CFFE746